MCANLSQRATWPPRTPAAVLDRRHHLELAEAHVAGMAQQDLNHPNVGVLFQQMRRKAVTKGVCGDTCLPISAMWAAAWQARLSWRVVIGLTGFIPGNSHPCGRAALYQARNSSSRCGDNITNRSLWPLPCSIRITMRSLSMSDTFSATTSDTRNPAPYRRRLALSSSLIPRKPKTFWVRT